MPDSEVIVAPVRSSGERRQFIDFPYRLYRNDPHWVAPLKMAQKDILNTERHPFYKSSAVELFLARRGDRVVGRIMVILNKQHNQFHREDVGFFGFFEVENDPPAAEALVRTGREWLVARGAKTMRGPVNPSTNYECGLLVEGFDRKPAVMMPYNPPYYSVLLENCGLSKAMDLYAYYVDEDTFLVSDKLTRVAERARK